MAGPEPVPLRRQLEDAALITQGELDYRVPINESMTTFKILQRQNVPARLVVFPDEGHWILKGENSRRHLSEIAAWLAKYLQPQRPGGPSAPPTRPGTSRTTTKPKVGTLHAAGSAEARERQAGAATPQRGRKSGGPS